VLCASEAEAGGHVSDFAQHELRLRLIRVGQRFAPRTISDLPVAIVSPAGEPAGTRATAGERRSRRKLDD
jgi:hypothetical protein